MKIDILTLFPSMFTGPFDESIIKRAKEKGLVKISLHNLRDRAIDKHGTVDDKPYGGGVGMVLRPEPIASALQMLKIKNQKSKIKNKEKIILLSASGKLFNQQKALQLFHLSHLTLICGHYEGVDQRIADYYADEELSIGDYVLTGGEIPAMVIVDSVVRLIPSVLTKGDATKFESFSLHPPTSNFKVQPPSSNIQRPILEYPHYTRPEIFEGHKVPKVLRSGNHQEIALWRREQALRRTKNNRPDLAK